MRSSVFCASVRLCAECACRWQRRSPGTGWFSSSCGRTHVISVRQCLKMEDVEEGRGKREEGGGNGNRTRGKHILPCPPAKHNALPTTTLIPSPLSPNAARLLGCGGAFCFGLLGTGAGGPFGGAGHGGGARSPFAVVSPSPFVKAPPEQPPPAPVCPSSLPSPPPRDASMEHPTPHRSSAVQCSAVQCILEMEKAAWIHVF